MSLINDRKITASLSNFLKEDFISIQKSRISWRNELYKIHAKYSVNNAFSVKIFINKSSPKKRFVKELTIDNYIPKSDLINVPKVLYFEKNISDKIYGLIIRPWINGTSLKDALLENPHKVCKEIMPQIVNCFKYLWDLEIDNFSHQISGKHTIGKGFFSNLNLKEDLIFKLVEHQFRSSILEINEIKEIYFSLTLAKNKMVLIHGDPSCHEFLINDNNFWWIDWESYNLSDSYLDFACFYFSCCHFFHMNIKTDEYVSNKLLEEFNMNINNNFIKYFIERLIASALLSGDSFNPGIFKWALSRINKLH